MCVRAIFVVLNSTIVCEWVFQLASEQASRQQESSEKVNTGVTERSVTDITEDTLTEDARQMESSSSPVHRENSSSDQNQETAVLSKLPSCEHRDKSECQSGNSDEGLNSRH